MSIYGHILPGSWHLSRIKDLSPNAKRRLCWLTYYEKNGRNARKTCRYFGIHHSTFYTWRKRYNPRNLLSLEGRKRGPRFHFRQSTTPSQTVELIVSLRRKYPFWSKYKLQKILSRDYQIRTSASTIGRILKRKGLINQEIKKRLRKRKASRIKRLKANLKIKDLFPGSLVQADVKHFHLNGRRFYQFTAIDCCTRLKFLRIYTGISSLTGERFLKEMLLFFPFKVKALQSDNGSEFLGRFHDLCQKRDITHYFTYAQCPKMNGRVERAIQASIYEFWEQGNLIDDLKELNKLAYHWMKVYNTIRPHQALNNQTPYQYYLSWRQVSG